MLPNYDDFLIKRFEQPDEVRTFEKGKFETVRIGSMTIGRANYEPGWKWSEHVGAATGAALCEVEHVGLVVSGCAACRMKDGRYYEMKPGDVFYIGPGHDSWVVGDEPYVSLHFLGAEHYAQPSQMIEYPAKCPPSPRPPRQAAKECEKFRVPLAPFRAFGG